MSLFAKTNNDQSFIDNSREDHSANPLAVIERLEERAVSELYPDVLPWERDDINLNLRDKNYISNFVNLHLNRKLAVRAKRTSQLKRK